MSYFIDIDECTAQSDNCNLQENFTCENTIGGYQCVCKTGFDQVGPQECRGKNSFSSVYRVHACQKGYVCVICVAV